MSTIIPRATVALSGRERNKLNGLSRPVGRELDRIEAHGLLAVAEEQVDAFITHTAMSEFTLLVDEAVMMSQRRPEAEPGLLLLASGFAQRAHRRASRR